MKFCYEIGWFSRISDQIQFNCDKTFNFSTFKGGARAPLALPLGAPLLEPIDKNPKLCNILKNQSFGSIRKEGMRVSPIFDPKNGMFLWHLIFKFSYEVSIRYVVLIGIIYRVFRLNSNPFIPQVEQHNMNSCSMDDLSKTLQELC